MFNFAKILDMIINLPGGTQVAIFDKPRNNLDRIFKPKGTMLSRWKGERAKRKLAKQCKKDFEKEQRKFKYIVTLTVNKHCIIQGKDIDCYGYYILYENDLGERKYDFTFSHTIMESIKKGTHTYAHIVAPWMVGYYTSASVVEWHNEQVSDNS